ncbi:copper transporter [Natronosporangium hydrolyticum]|uniref:Copper transporter n=1 Tax=Natronosporangium hydrolyticum TaxID=2811111 RepID=A0A895YFZ3_9ACTN|nr:copper transporter [Natronosporangium hydrolyticum]QSB12588.1 copper transporter [Natronosporangium hydrolyticum]
MINFRYHVVSLTAVFLALAVGLVLGSTVLNGPMLDALENRVNTLGRDNSQLREQVSFLEEEVDREHEFAAEAAPMLLTETLTGRDVTLVVLPHGEDYVDGVAGMLELAGAELTGQLTLTEKFTHPQHRLGELLDLAHRAVPDGVDADSLPANSDGVETSAALLAAVLLAADGGAELGDPEALGPDADAEDVDESALGVSDDDRSGVLSAYAAQDYLVQDEPVSRAAELVVVVAGLPDSDTDADERNEASLMTVRQFAEGGRVLVAGSGVAGDGNLVTGVRGDPELTELVTTVDNASTPQGQVAAGLAAAARLGGEVGHYGRGDGAEQLLPDPVTR